MIQKTKTTTQTTAEAADIGAMPVSHMGQDLKTAVLIVSIVANLFIFTAWVALQVTTQFDTQISSVLFTR